ncbi:DUF2635 domain-containing protein [Salmonella enterica]|nr:DUF2635 domain-containing protein [Salmonella enterica]EHH5781164.1 DUF2635 domain-containing protein [Salmonella enterica]ELE3234342.1 DUF2635 domain-containing protein [Salmonella enterica subsp. enterica serovar Pomona]ELZ0794989.1 DUF2635 domain-containing protein [Salmonella enterica]
MKKLKLYPTRRGLIVRDPRTKKALSEDGEEKEKNGYWLRRMREGSVSEKPLPALTTAETKVKGKQPETDK